MRRIIVACISVCMAVCLSAQDSGLFTHNRGYFIKNGDSWEECMISGFAKSKLLYNQYNEDDNYYYLSCESSLFRSVAVPKTSVNSFYLKNGDEWKLGYETRWIYDNFNDSGRDLYCHENGYFVRDGYDWRLYLPEKRSGVWASFTTYREDDNYLYISNESNKIAIPKNENNPFYIMNDDGVWNELYTGTAIYLGGAGASLDKLYADNNVDAESMLQMAYSYYLGKDGYEKNHEKAFSYFKKAADAGVSESYWPLGILYYYGYGVEKDYDSAFVYLKKAAAAGVVESYCLLADMYFRGRGTAKDEANAFLYASKAAEGGDVDGLSMLAKLYYESGKKDYKKAFEYALKAAEAGSTDGQAFLGLLYYTGRGVRKNYKKAVSWLTKAAESGNADGMILLAECYYNGEGVKADADTAKEWFDRAADARERITAYFSFYYDKMLFSIYSYEFECLF